MGLHSLNPQQSLPLHGHHKLSTTYHRRLLTILMKFIQGNDHPLIMQDNYHPLSVGLHYAVISRSRTDRDYPTPVLSLTLLIYTTKYKIP